MNGYVSVRRMAWPTRALFAWLCTAALLAGCAAAPAPRPTHLEAARRGAHGARDPEVVGAWLLAELLAPGGDVKRARLARLDLARRGGAGRQASLARAIDAEAHGRLRAAAEAYLAALGALRSGEAPEGPLLAWLAANRLRSLAASAAGVGARARPFVDAAVAEPGRLGWRARGELVEWWTGLELGRAGGLRGEALLDAVARLHGCVLKATIAGPFGHGAPTEHRIRFEAERPGPWPARFAADPQRREAPLAYEAQHRGCLLRPRPAVPAGIYYVQTFLDLPAARELTIAVQGAYALLVDDTEVLARDTATWGIWPRFGAALRLAAGRHRILARLGSPETTVRVLGPDGRPAALEGSSAAGPPYRLVAPERRPDPNALAPFLGEAGVPAQAGVPVSGSELDRADPLTRYAAAYLAHVEGQDDLAHVLIEPLVVRPAEATPLALAQQAVFVEADPIFSRSDARDLAKDLRQRAAERDPELWGPQLWLVLDEAEKEGPRAAARRLEELSAAFPEVPQVLERLGAVYASLGWSAQQARAVELGARRFPESPGALEALLGLHERRGELAAADAVAARIRALDPTSEIDLRRALGRRDWAAAAAELRRIAQTRQDRAATALRIADLLERAGQHAEPLAQLELAVQQDPGDAAARLALADGRLAAGEPGALTDALVEAIRTGAESQGLRDAIELTEGLTDLEPFRRDGRRIIAAFEAEGARMSGTAARVLDYAALWIRPDGSARMLEHEVIRIQSREALADHAEQQVPEGLVLRLRTVKSDGRVLEPELVAGKPTATMPHLEVGDYIETEAIWPLRGDGQGGRAFLSPRWFFREEKVAYHTSELVVIAPAGRPLEIETTGQVPEPVVEQRGALTVRRWRVEASPALSEEPLGAPIEEFLPSVQVGWGVDLDARLLRLAEANADETPLDPRLRRIARTIVRGRLDGSRSSPGTAGAPPDPDEAARRIYRWVLDTIQPGSEQDPRRVIMGKSGDRTRAFLHLCRLAGIDARLGLVESRLAPPPRGPLSAALRFREPAVRVQAAHGVRWLLVRDRFAPYGYLPDSLRAQPAVVLGLRKPPREPAAPALWRENTPAAGALDEVSYEGSAELRADGSAHLELVQRYAGSFAIGLRSGLSNVPEERLRDVVEAKLLAPSLPGGRVATLHVQALDALDEPLGLSLGIDVASFARRTDRGLVLAVPFLPQLGALGGPATRETPLYLSEKAATRVAVRLDIALPPGARVANDLGETALRHERCAVRVADRMEAGRLRIDRQVTIPAGRVQPEQYARFRAFVLAADAALNRELQIELR